MGIDYDSKLVIGWLVDNEKVREQLAAKDTVSCSEGCLCSNCVETLDIPEGWKLVVTSPYFDSEWAEHIVAVSAKFECDDSRCECLYHGMSVPADVVIPVLSNTALLEAGFSFAVTLGADKRKTHPLIISLPHIW